MKISFTLHDPVEIDRLKRVTEHFNAISPDTTCTPEVFAAVVLARALHDRCCELDRRAEQHTGAWKGLRCDVCGTTFDGFHVLSAEGDRCCPRCSRKRRTGRGDCAGGTS